MLFTKTEYKERLINVQTEMQKKEIDLLISSDPANMNYLSGYDAHSFYMLEEPLSKHILMKKISPNIPKNISILHPHIHMSFWLK